MKDIEVLKKNGIDVDRSLELLGDLDTYDEMLESFLEESEVRLPRMKEAKEKADLANYAIDAHAMKSDSRYLGFTKLAELSYNHEIAGKENHIDFIEGHYDELMKEVQRMIEVIRQYLEK